ncbi:MAG: hypothetical protein ACRD18_05025 [Terriglobia bacterium]
MSALYKYCPLATTVTYCLQQNEERCNNFIQQLLGSPLDPNYLVGPSGAGAQRWLSGAVVLPYVIGFGNESTATAPAQQVVVIKPLSTSLNLSTLSLSGITIPSGTSAPSIQVPIPQDTFNPAAGLDEFVTNVDLRPTQNLLVNVDAKLDTNTNTITWTLTSIDPTTGQLPTNAGVGFLPPGAEGSVLFTIAPKDSLPTGSAISDQASVVFSNSGISNSPVNTNTWLNALDNTPPISQVAELPADESSSCFKVQWSGSDVGSGVQGYTIFVSDTGGPYTIWQNDTSATSSIYNGEAGHTYAFYSQATDVAGNIEAAKTSPDTTTTVGATAGCGGGPTLSGRIVSRSLAGTSLTIVLQLTNTGTGPAENIQINQFGLRTLTGSDSATYLGLLPLSAGSLAPGASENLPLMFNVPSTVTKFSLSENGSVQDAAGNTYNFSIGQAVYP